MQQTFVDNIKEYYKIFYFGSLAAYLKILKIHKSLSCSMSHSILDRHTQLGLLTDLWQLDVQTSRKTRPKMTKDPTRSMLLRTDVVKVKDLFFTEKIKYMLVCRCLISWKEGLLVLFLQIINFTRHMYFEVWSWLFFLFLLLLRSVGSN